ncbi:MAG: hypothetical protein QOD45_459 [Pseudonocardiales bacterium]|nr:hypothetical protein [Pseudonocardiales bacterium]
MAAGCAGGANASAPTWVPQPSFTGDGAGRGGSSSTPGAPGGGPGGPSGRSGTSGAPGPDPAVVATGLTAPVGLTLLPDNTALVGERTTGRVVRVQSRPGQPVQTVRTLTGLDPTGDGGLMDLAISPHYAQDNLIYAYVTTATDNRVVEFTLTGPVTPVVAGIPKGKTDNTGRLAFDGVGDLYVGTGDAGHPELAADHASLAGKVLRVTDVGSPATGNPVPSSPVYTTGHRVVDGLCYSARQDTMVEVEGNHINALVAGADYGWPRTTPGTRKPMAVLPAVAPVPGGCAVQEGRLYVTSLDGQSVLSTLLTSSGTTVITGRFSAGLTKIYGRLRTVVAAADGALWLTTSNRDGRGAPIPADERVIRILASSLGTSSSPV